jgi:hypothetical protein
MEVPVPDDGFTLATQLHAVEELAPLAPQDLAHAVIEGAFGLVFPDPQARRALGVTAISRAKCASTAWYLWTKHRAGAFEIAQIPGDEQSGSVLLALRYFPHPSEPLFERFAPAERDCRRSTAFDATGTPRFDEAEQIDPSLFHVGTLALALASSGDDCVALTLYAQDRWTEQVLAGRDWMTRRDVPGIELAFAAIDPLLCALAYLGGRGPGTVRAWQEPGLCWRIGNDGTNEAIEDPRLGAWRIEFGGLALPGLVVRPTTAFVDARSDDSEPVLEIHALRAHTPLPVDRRWWRAARWRFDPVGAHCAACAADSADIVDPCAGGHHGH